MDVVSAHEGPNGALRSRPVLADFLPAATAGPEGGLQVFENLYENQRNTNVIEVTERSDKSRENINLIWVLCRPKVNARCGLQGPIHRGFAGLPGRPWWVKRPFVAVPQNERNWGL